MQGSRIVDEFDRYYAESLSGGVRIPDPNSASFDSAHHPADLNDVNQRLQTIPDNSEDGDFNGRNKSIINNNVPGGNYFNSESYQRAMLAASGGDRRWSNASSRSSRSRSSSSGSSHRGLSIPERVAVTREGLVEEIIEKWRAALDDQRGLGGSKIIITDDENNSRFHDFTSSSSSSTGSRPRANTFSGRSASRSPPQNLQTFKVNANSDDPIADSSDCAIGDLDEPQGHRQRAYSTNAATANHLLGTDGSYNSSRRSSGGQIFHFAVERRPSVTSRILSFLGARSEPKRCEIAIRQLTPLEASNVPSATDIKTMELLLIGQEGVGRKEIVRSLLTATTAPPVGNEGDRNRLPSIDSEISWDEQTCIVARSYLEVDTDIVNFTARCAATEEETDRCLTQALPDVILAIYSVTDFTSVSVARSLLSYAGQRTPKRTALCMVANKADLSGLASNNAATNLSSSPLRGLSRELSGGSVNRSTGRAAAKSVSASWLETSAVISLNIRTLLAALLQHWIQNNASTIAEEQQKESSRRSSVNGSNSGSFRNASSSNKPSRTSSLLVKQQNQLDEPGETTGLNRAKSEKHQRSRSPSPKLPRPSSHHALISACHPLFSVLCVSKSNGATDDKNSNSNDSGVQDSPTMSNQHRKESAL